MRIAFMVTALFLLSSLAGTTAWAEAGVLDPAFGSGGIAQPALPQSGQVVPARTLVQADGSILILLQFRSSIGAVVERLNADGVLDTSFGVSGAVMEPPDYSISSMALPSRRLL